MQYSFECIPQPNNKMNPPGLSTGRGAPRADRREESCIPSSRSTGRKLPPIRLINGKLYSRLQAWPIWPINRKETPPVRPINGKKVAARPADQREAIHSITSKYNTWNLMTFKLTQWPFDSANYMQLNSNTVKDVENTQVQSNTINYIQWQTNTSRHNEFKKRSKSAKPCYTGEVIELHRSSFQ